MNTTSSLSYARRKFLADVGRGVLVATVGSSVASDIGLGSVQAQGSSTDLQFGDLEPLVGMMQDTSADRLLERLRDELQAGTSLRRLVAAGALANARMFGGEDYIGYHTLMALAPALGMAERLPEAEQPLPVFKVLYRNTDRMQDKGGSLKETLKAVSASIDQNDPATASQLREAVHRQNLAEAEKILAALARNSPDEAFNALLHTVQDHTEVHRVVLPYRAWELLAVTGPEHALTLLRQSVHYCVQAESYQRADQDEPARLLPKLLETHQLLDRAPGTRIPEDAWVEQFSEELFRATGAQAAEQAAAAMAEGIAPDAIGEAISLAANQLVLRDHGRRPREEQPGKPVGSVHGDSIGVHASDSANAWRNLARASNARNTFACTILGAYQVAVDRVRRGGDFENWSPLPVKWHLDQVKNIVAGDLLAEAEDAIRQNLQARAAALIHRYGKLGHEPKPVFDLLLRYAVSEDGALHAEKYFHTATEEFMRTRPAFRWRQLMALARVTASEYGRPAPGMAKARELLKV